MIKTKKADLLFALEKMVEAFDIGQYSGPNGAIAIARKALGRPAVPCPKTKSYDDHMSSVPQLSSFKRKGDFDHGQE